MDKLSTAFLDRGFNGYSRTDLLVNKFELGSARWLRTRARALTHKCVR